MKEGFGVELGDRLFIWSGRCSEFVEATVYQVKILEESETGCLKSNEMVLLMAHNFFNQVLIFRLDQRMHHFELHNARVNHVGHYQEANACQLHIQPILLKSLLISEGSQVV